MSEAQKQNLARLRWGLSKDLRYRGDSANATVRLLSASVLAKPETAHGDPVQLASTFLAENGALFLLQDPAKELDALTPEADELGGAIIRFQQTYGGLEVWPARLTAQTNRAGILTVVTGAYVPTPSNLDLTPAINAESALGRAAAHLGLARPEEAFVHSPATLKIFAPKGHVPELSYELILEAGAKQERIFVSAQTGDILLSISEICTGATTGSGKDIFGQTKSLSVYSAGSPTRYYLYDTTKPMHRVVGGEDLGVIQIFDGSKSESPIISSSALTSGFDAAGVSAAYNIGKAYDFYKQEFNRDSYDGNGSSLIAYVKVPDADGTALNNAFWSHAAHLMAFGSGDRFVGATDVIGHELTHAIVEFTAGLVYTNESGALNESFADILGESFERYLGGTQDWLVGTNLDPNGPFGGPLRSLKAPGLKNQPARMSQFERTSEDNGGVHINSGIPNHAFYLLAEGLSSGGIGFIPARNIFYRALTTKLNKNSDFHDLRDACIASAEELFGAGSTQASKTALAFNAVEIFDRSAPAAGSDLTPVAGTNALLATELYDDGNYYLGRRESTQGDDLSSLRNLSPYAVNPDTRLSISGNGSLAAYVSADHDFVVVDTLSGKATRANSPGAFNSAALSQDGRHLALILRDPNTGEAINQISYLDLESDADATIDLYLPVIDGPSTLQITAIDELDISPDGQIAVFDALAETRLTTPGGAIKTVRAWSLFAVDLSTHDVFVLGGPYDGINIGNPAFARTSASRIAFDFEVVNASGTRASSGICTVDLGKADSLDITSQYTPASVYPGFPSFFAADDGITFTETAYYAGYSYPRLAARELLSDKLTGTGDAVALSDFTHAGLVYRRGTFVGVPTIAIAARAASVVGGSSSAFRISRVSGDTSVPVPVSFKAIGSARPMVDYAKINLAATLPANQTYVDVPISCLLTPEAAACQLTLSLDPQSYYLLSPSAKTATMALTPPALSYAYWASANGAGGASADDDGDGLNNFLEYVLGTNPKVASATYATLELVEVGLQRFAQLRVARSRIVPDLAWALQRSADRTTWSSASYALVSSTDTELVLRDSLPLNEGETRYLRVQFNDTTASASTSSLGCASLMLSNLNQVYGAVPRSVTVNGVPNGLVPIVTYGGSATPPSNAGSYPVSVTLNTAGVIGSASGTLVVAKAPLTVSAPNVSRLQGRANPALTLSYVGFAGADSVAVLDVVPKASTSAVKASPPGDYPITLSAGSDNNYVLNLTLGVIHVRSFGGSFEAFVVDPESNPVGKIELAIPATAITYTGTLRLADEVNPIALKGSLTPSTDYTTATIVVNRAASSALPALGLSLSLNGAALSGSVTRGGLPVGTLQNVTLLAVPPAPLGTGAYTLIVNQAEGANAPRGYGYATGAIAAKTAFLSLSGKLADGTKFTASFKPAADRSYRLWVNPYAKRTGCYVASRFVLQAHPDTARFADRFYLPASASDLIWKKSDSLADASYRSGFGPIKLEFTCDPWLAPTTTTVLGQRLGLAVDGLLALAHGDLDGTSDDTLPLSASLLASKVTPAANLNSWKITFTPKTGAFTGSFVLKDPAPLKPRTVLFGGVLRQRPNLNDTNDPLVGAGTFVFGATGAASSAEKQSAAIVLTKP